MNAERYGEAGSNVVTALHMIFPTPTDEQIRSAHVITFFDPQRPEFHFVLVNTLDRTKQTPLELLVIDIPIDSDNAQVIAHWLGRIDGVRLRPPSRPSQLDSTVTEYQRERH